MKSGLRAPPTAPSLVSNQRPLPRAFSRSSQPPERSRYVMLERQRLERLVVSEFEARCGAAGRTSVYVCGKGLPQARMIFRASPRQSPPPSKLLLAGGMPRTRCCHCFSIWYLHRRHLYHVFPAGCRSCLTASWRTCWRTCCAAAAAPIQPQSSWAEPAAPRPPHLPQPAPTPEPAGPSRRAHRSSSRAQRLDVGLRTRWHHQRSSRLRGEALAG